MSNAKCAEIEHEGSSFKSVAELLLINRDCVNQNIAHRGADLVPFGAIVSQATQDDRVSFGNLYIVMIWMFSPDCDRVRVDVRTGVHAGSDWIGDNFGPFGRRDLEEIMTKKLDNRIASRCVSRACEAAGDIELSTCRICHTEEK